MGASARLGYRLVTLGRKGTASHDRHTEEPFMATPTLTLLRKWGREISA